MREGLAVWKQDMSYYPEYKVFEITPEGEEFDLNTVVEVTDDNLIPVLKKWKLLDNGLPLSCILVDFDGGTYTVSVKVPPRKTSKFITCLKLVGPWREHSGERTTSS